MRTAIEALFSAMVTEGWANDSDGNVEAPTGHFARITNQANELVEIRAAFADVIETYGNPDDSEIIGNFVVKTDNNGNLDITRYTATVTTLIEFDKLSRAYANWHAC